MLVLALVSPAWTRRVQRVDRRLHRRWRARRRSSSTEATAGVGAGASGGERKGLNEGGQTPEERGRFSQRHADSRSCLRECSASRRLAASGALDGRGTVEKIPPQPKIRMRRLCEGRPERGRTSRKETGTTGTRISEAHGGGRLRASVVERAHSHASKSPTIKSVSGKTLGSRGPPMCAIVLRLLHSDLAIHFCLLVLYPFWSALSKTSANLERRPVFRHSLGEVRTRLLTCRGCQVDPSRSTWWRRAAPPVRLCRTAAQLVRGLCSRACSTVVADDLPLYHSACMDRSTDERPARVD